MNLTTIPLYDHERRPRAIVETPRGSRVKLRYAPALELFEFGRPLPLGLSYPFDWGFFPSTRAPDGDPLDVLIYHDAATFPGVLISLRLMGAIILTQESSSGEGREHNDRIIAFPADDSKAADVTGLPERVKAELEHFFVSAVAFSKKCVQVERWADAAEATTVLARASAAAQGGG